MFAAQVQGNESFIHRLNPITKLIAVVLFWITALFSAQPVPLLIMIFISLILWTIAKMPLSPLKPVFFSLAFVLVLFTVLNGFLYYRGQKVLFHVLGAPFFLDGVLFGLSVWLKIVAIVAIFPVLTLTTPLQQLLAALAKLKVPYKANFSLGIAFRLTPLVSRTYRDISESQLLRGHDLKRMNFFVRLVKGYLPVFIPLIMTLLRRSADLDVAIESRGFGMPKERTYLADVKMHRNDWIFLTVFVLAFSIVIYLTLHGGDLSMIYYWL